MVRREIIVSHGNLPGFSFFWNFSSFLIHGVAVLRIPTLFNCGFPIGQTGFHFLFSYKCSTSCLGSLSQSSLQFVNSSDQCQVRQGNRIGCKAMDRACDWWTSGMGDWGRYSWKRVCRRLKKWWSLVQVRCHLEYYWFGTAGIKFKIWYLRVGSSVVQEKRENNSVK